MPNLQQQQVLPENVDKQYQISRLISKVSNDVVNEKIIQSENIRYEISCTTEEDDFLIIMYTSCPCKCKCLYVI